MSATARAGARAEAFVVLVAMVALASLIALAAAAPRAAAADTATGVRLDWCAGAAPHLAVDGLLPGDERALDLDVCNTGTLAGVLVATATAVPQGAVGDTTRISFRDGSHVLWTGRVNRIDGVVLGSSSLPAGSARRLTVVLDLPASAGNDVAGSQLSFRLLLQLTQTGTPLDPTTPGAVVAVGGETVSAAATPANPPGSTSSGAGSSLPFTGADVAGTVLVAVGAIALGGLLSGIRRRA